MAMNKTLTEAYHELDKWVTIILVKLVYVKDTELMNSSSKWKKK